MKAEQHVHPFIPTPLPLLLCLASHPLTIALSKFIKEFADEQAEYPYLNQINQLLLRNISTFTLRLDDVEMHGDSGRCLLSPFSPPQRLLPQPVSVLIDVLRDLCEKIETNTRRYIRIIAEVVDSLLDMMPAVAEAPDKDVFDVMRQQRMATIRAR
jgi:hypothetical protein